MGITKEELSQSLVNEIDGAQKHKLTEDSGNAFGLTNGDANNCHGMNKTYIGENITNSPTKGTGIWWTINSYVQGQYGHQVATAWHSDERHMRNKRADNWSAWRSL